MSVKRRIQNELRNYNLEKHEDDTVRLEVATDDFLNLKGYIEGVKGTPYEGGVFKLDINIGEGYPYKAPTIKFLTKIWHPSVNPFDGTICLPTHEDGSWPVAMTIHKTLLSIQSWMSTVHAQEPVDVQILEQAVKKPTVFAKTAEFWTIRFAGARKPFNRDYQMKVQFLSRYTLNEEPAIVALSYHDWVLPEDGNISQ